MSAYMVRRLRKSPHDSTSKNGSLLQYGTIFDRLKLAGFSKRQIRCSNHQRHSCYGWLVAILMICSGCSSRISDHYNVRYSYLRELREEKKSPRQFTGTDPYYLVVLVDARHLDYSSPENYFYTMSHGLFKRQDPYIGHAWIILGTSRGVTFETGHTGEFGVVAPRYFDEVIARARRGVDPNPIAYLYTVHADGRLEQGSGGHKPTFAAAFPLNQEGFVRIRRLVEQTYDGSQWGIIGPNCLSLVRACLASVGVSLDCSEVIRIPSHISLDGATIKLWENPIFSDILVQTPECLERRLLECVRSGRALCACRWYTSPGSRIGFRA